VTAPGLTLYGEPAGAAPGTRVVSVPIEVAPAFAAAHHRLRGGAVGIHAGGGEIDVVHPAPTGPDGGTDRWVAPSEDVVAAVRAARRPVVVAGPGVVRLEAVAGLHDLAVAAGVGVLNTWGAKGVFDWRSRHHLGTIGLQARDGELAGLAAADLVVTTGLDPAEWAPDAAPARTVDVHPWSLAPLAELVARSPTAVARPPLFDALAAVTQAGWARAAGPLVPTRVTRTYGERLGGVGLVAADPGVAGFWVARTVPTVGLRGVVVSSDPAAGSAVATAVVSRLLDPARPVLAVVDELGGAVRAHLDAARALGVPVAVECWTDAGDALDAEAHRTRLDEVLGRGGEVALSTDGSQMAEIVAVAGEVTAWGGLLGAGRR
jgi:thiamine pyrophosphate-dependent acetolactate synthase large subunit-like protein